MMALCNARTVNDDSTKRLAALVIFFAAPKAHLH